MFPPDPATRPTDCAGASGFCRESHVRSERDKLLEACWVAEELAKPAYNFAFSGGSILDINAGPRGRIRQERGTGMAGRTVVVRLNQQQIELIDRTIRRGEAPDRVSLIRKALREQARKQPDGAGR
jgi:hypothetical protein